MDPDVLSGRITDTQVMSCRGGQWAVKNYYPPSKGYVSTDQNIVSWVSGGLFETGWEGGNININGTLYVSWNRNLAHFIDIDNQRSRER